MENFDISKEAVLVAVKIGSAGLTARSRILSEEAAEKHEADRSSVSGVVQILKPADRKGIVRASNMARSTLYFNTLPWDDGAYRLCPLPRYDNLRREMAEIEELFNAEVQDLVSRHDELAKDYRKRVKDLADEVRFPSLDEFSQNFNFRLIESPIANPAQVVLNGLSEDELENLRKRVTADIDERLQAAGHEIIFRLIELVSKLKTQVGKDPKETKFHKSLIGNIEEAVRVLPSLNVTNNPEIDRLITRVKRDLSSIDVEDLKDSAQIRAKTEKVASIILKDLKGYK